MNRQTGPRILSDDDRRLADYLSQTAATDAELLRKTPSLSAYLRRVGAIRKNFRKYVVEADDEPRYGNLRRHVATISIQAGSIFWDNDIAAPLPDEKSAIEKEISAVNWPRSLCPHNTGSLQELLGKDATLYVYRTRDGSGVLFVQQRVRTDEGGKADHPWSHWSDGRWRMLEPDNSIAGGREPNGLLPLFGLQYLPPKSRVMLHEGAKAAAYLQWLTSDDREARAVLRKHPWGNVLEDYAHLGWPGGAQRARDVDWAALRQEPDLVEIVLACDNDAVGVNAATEISRRIGRSMKMIIFDDRFPQGFDLADPMPYKSNPDWLRVERYVGPPLEDFVFSATWATEAIVVKGKKPAYRARKEFIEEWLAVAEPQVLINRVRPDRLLSEHAFNKTVRPVSDVDDTARLLAPHTSAHADGIAYLPGEELGVIVRDNARLVNTFRPTRIKPLLGDIGPFTNFMEHLVPDENDRRALLRWCATLIARPKIRMHYGVLLISETQGVGKGTLGEAILAPLVGVDNTSFPTEQTILRSDYNAWIAHKRLAIIHEIYSGQSRKVYDNLKSTITDNHVDVNKKFIGHYRLDNWVHVFACSNSLQAMHLDDDDRRWFVPKISETQRAATYWQEFHAWLKLEGLGIILRWTHEFLKENGPVQTGERAPMSIAKRDIIAASRSAGQQLAFDLVDEIKALPKEGGREPRVVLVIDEVREWIAGRRGFELSDNRLEKPLTIRKALVAAGLFALATGENDRFKVNGKMSAVVANFHCGPVKGWSEISMHRKRPEDLVTL